jgi:hypothetical protein
LSSLFLIVFYGFSLAFFGQSIIVSRFFIARLRKAFLYFNCLCIILFIKKHYQGYEMSVFFGRVLNFQGFSICKFPLKIVFACK